MFYIFVQYRIHWPFENDDDDDKNDNNNDNGEDAKDDDDDLCIVQFKYI